MMNDGKRKWTQVVYLGLVVIAFFAGLGVAGYRLNKIIPCLSSTLNYDNYIHSAANYAQLLLDSRKGDTSAVIQRLENCVDLSILMAYDYTNSVVKVFRDTPWSQLKMDRAKHPREPKKLERETRINVMLDILIQEQSQFTNRPHFSAVAVTNR